MNNTATPQNLKPVGWFSRRHQTRDEHVAARERYLAEHGPAARRRKATERRLRFEANLAAHPAQFRG